MCAPDGAITLRLMPRCSLTGRRQVCPLWAGTDQIDLGPLCFCVYADRLFSAHHSLNWRQGTPPDVPNCSAMGGPWSGQLSQARLAPAALSADRLAGQNLLGYATAVYLGQLLQCLQLQVLRGLRVPNSSNGCSCSCLGVSRAGPAGGLLCNVVQGSGQWVAQAGTLLEATAAGATCRLRSTSLGWQCRQQLLWSPTSCRASTQTPSLAVELMTRTARELLRCLQPDRHTGIHDSLTGLHRRSNLCWQRSCVPEYIAPTPPHG